MSHREDISKDLYDKMTTTGNGKNQLYENIMNGFHRIIYQMSSILYELLLTSHRIFERESF